MSAQHTPGPWTSSREDMDSFSYCPDEDDGIGNPSLSHVVYIYRGEQPRIAVFAGALKNAREDARLIAAAPELLELLEEIYNDGENLISNEHVQRAIALTQKVRGGSQ